VYTTPSNTDGEPWIVPPVVAVHNGWQGVEQMAGNAYSVPVLSPAYATPPTTVTDD